MGYYRRSRLSYRAFVSVNTLNYELCYVIFSPVEKVSRKREKLDFTDNGVFSPYRLLHNIRETRINLAGQRGTIFSLKLSYLNASPVKSL